jgi:hypothetical protein
MKTNWRNGRLLLCLGVSLLLAVPWLRGDEVKVEQKPFAELSNQDIDEDGRIALAIRPDAWLHGEITHYILHYRRITEALHLATEIDFHLLYVAKVLGAGPERFGPKSHVYIFEDAKDWKTFLEQTHTPPWAASFAHGTSLFLNVRDARTGIFDSQTLAHETTHAVVARLFPEQRWPLWLSEGFAEQMSGMSTSARMGQYNQRLLQHYHFANLPLAQLTTMTQYPADPQAVLQLYQSSEKLVRFMMTQLPPDRFPKFIDALVVQNQPMQAAVVQVYGDKFPDFAAFTKAYARVPN